MHPEINKAIAAHGMSKSRFQDFMAGKITLEESAVAKPDACDFGKWLAKDGKTSPAANSPTSSIFTRNSTNTLLRSCT